MDNSVLLEKDIFFPLYKFFDFLYYYQMSVRHTDGALCSIFCYIHVPNRFFIYIFYFGPNGKKNKLKE